VYCGARGSKPSKTPAHAGTKSQAIANSGKKRPLKNDFSIYSSRSVTQQSGVSATGIDFSFHHFLNNQTPLAFLSF
jgi:hypothetical protein